MTHGRGRPVVVVTGASRGIGRASARLLAERGAAVVLAARSEEGLRAAAADCEAAGGEALAVPTDVADPAAVEDLARRAVERFGKIDVWVNGAVMLAFGRLEEVPAEANRRIVETNLLGYIHGAQAAIPRFREQGWGTLIQLSSGFGLVGAPYAGAYAATKFAQRGLSQALRGELRGTGVEVCTIMPGGVDTPAYRHAANYTGRAAAPKGPLADPETIARVVVRCAERPRPEVVVGPSVRTLRLAHALAPRAVEAAIARTIESGFLWDEPTGTTPGNLFVSPASWTEEDGGFNEAVAGRARRGVRRNLPLAAPALAAGLATGIAAWLLLRGRRGG